MKLELFHETLASALNNGVAYLVAQGAQIDPQAEYDLREKFAFDGVKYEETKTGDCPLISFKGKPTKKWGHLSIYRMSSGRYELTAYIL